MPKPRRPRVASPDEVKITRDGDAVVIEYADATIGATHLSMEPGKLATMTDAEVLAFWNDHIEATDAFIRSQRFTLTEIPPGKPQVEYSEISDQWVPRGHVVRAVILTDCAVEPGLDEPFVSIDNRDFTVAEFVKMVATFGGWGVRLEFVGDQETHERPKVKVREPKQPKQQRTRKRVEG